VLFLFALSQSIRRLLLCRAAKLGVPAPPDPGALAGFNGVNRRRACRLARSRTGWDGGAVIVAGWAVYAACYVGFVLRDRRLAPVLIFAFYGLFYGLTEGRARAAGRPAARGGKGPAFGWFTSSLGSAFCARARCRPFCGRATGRAWVFCRAPASPPLPPPSFLWIDYQARAVLSAKDAPDGPSFGSVAAKRFVSAPFSTGGASPLPRPCACAPSRDRRR